jgi:hypothetical protein
MQSRGGPRLAARLPGARSAITLMIGRIRIGSSNSNMLMRKVRR